MITQYAHNAKQTLIFQKPDADYFRQIHFPTQVHVNFNLTLSIYIQILRTEPESVVLKNFLEWLSTLESKHGKPDGIILLYHEEYSSMPHMLLHALQKYSLLLEFDKMVKCFLNCSNLAKTYVGDQEYKYLGLSKLSLLLSKSKEPPKYKKGCAQVRARMVFNVALQLMNRDRKSDSQSFENIHNLYLILKPFTESIDEHLKQLYVETETLKRENTFRPLFLHYFENTMHRARATKFRICLSENGYDLHILRALWRDKRQEGLTSALRSLDGLTIKQKSELVDLLDSYFDPRKDICKPPVRCVRQRRRTQVIEETPETGDYASYDGSKSEDETPDLADLASLNNSSNSKTSKHLKAQSDKQQKKSLKSFMKNSTSEGPKTSQLHSKR